MKQQGQIILILILVMTVALGIGLSIIQRSLVDISTASKADQSSRALSAAEAGVESTLYANSPGEHTFTDTLSGFKTVFDSGLKPCIPGSPPCVQLGLGSGAQQLPLEYPPLAKEDIVQVWLADPSATLPNDCVPPSTGKVCYNQPTLDVYWGDSSIPLDKAALELTLVYYDGSNYQSRKWYLDHPITRTPANGFDNVNACSGNYSLPGYQCFKTLGNSTGVNNIPLPTGLMLIRARLLYNTNSQPFAVQATGLGASCTGSTGNGCYLPAQARQITSTGISGQTQRTVKLFKLSNVVPPFFDYALFSAGDINKQ